MEGQVGGGGGCNDDRDRGSRVFVGGRGGGWGGGKGGVVSAVDKSLLGWLC